MQNGDESPERAGDTAAPGGLGMPIGRRDFVRATGGILVATTIGQGCVEVGAPNSGFVEVVIDGFPPGTTNFGSATVTGGDLAEPIQFMLTSATKKQSVLAGAYVATYLPPSGFTVAPSTPTTDFDVVVEVGGTARVEFTVIATTTAFRLQVNGPDTAPHGGRISIQRTDIPGQDAILVTDIALGVETVLGVLPGTYTLDHSAPAGHVLAAGQTDPLSIPIADGASVVQTYTLVQSAPPAAIVFSSDFGTALGAGASAILDTGKAKPWNLSLGADRGALEVISSSGLNFPTPNVLRVTSLAAVGGAGIVRVTGMPIPSEGQSRYYRWYMRQTHPNGLEDSETHPIQDGNAAGDSNWLFHVMHNLGGAGKWSPQLRVGANPYELSYWTGAPLDKGVTYRFELRVHRLTTLTFNLHIKVFIGDNVIPLQTNADFANPLSPPTATLAGLPLLTFRNVDNLDGLNAGCNGISGSNPPFPFIYGYQGGFAVSGADWIGPYSGGV